MKNLLITFTFLTNLMGQIDFSNSIITLIDKNGNEHKNVTIQFSENSSLITLPKITLSDSSEIDIDDIQLVNVTVRKYGFANNTTMFFSALSIALLSEEAFFNINDYSLRNILESWIAITGLSFPLINSFKGKAFNSPYKIDFSNMSVAEKMKTLELLSIDRKQFNELITEHEETINSIIIEKENKDSKAKKYIAYPIIAAAGIGAAVFMLLIIAFSS